MKFTCLQEHLLKSITAVERAVARTAHLPVLQNIFLEATDGRLKLAATNLEIGIVSWCQGRSEAPGALTLPARAFSGLIGTLPPDKVTIEAVAEGCRIGGGSLQATLKSLPADEFPPIPEIKNDRPLLVDSARLIEGLARVLESAAAESSRAELGGVLFATTKDALTLVATDSFRLALAAVTSVQTEGVSPLFFQDHAVIIPRQAARELMSFVDTGDAQVAVSIDEHQVQFAQNDFRLISRLIEGVYPRYEDIIPQAFIGRKRINRRDLLQALKRIELFSGRLQRVEIAFAGEECHIFTEDPLLGSATERVRVDGEGPDVKFAFNIRYLLGGLTTFSSEEALFEYNEPTTPVVLRAQEGDRSLYIVMPMKLE